MKIHYLNNKGEEVFINKIIHLQNVNNNVFIALTESGKELTLAVSHIEGLADSKLVPNDNSTYQNLGEYKKKV